jgi:hypothetical protein
MHCHSFSDMNFILSVKLQAQNPLYLCRTLLELRFERLHPSITVLLLHVNNFVHNPNFSLLSFW